MSREFKRASGWRTLAQMAVLGVGLSWMLLPVTRGATGSAGGTIVLGGELTREYHLEAGGHVEGRLVLSNLSGEASRVRIYQTDYTFTADGKTNYGEPGTLPRSNAAWIELDEHEPELKP